MSDLTPSKCLGGWGLATLRFEVLEDIPGHRFPRPGSTCAAWPWGPTIHRIDETGHCIELGKLDELVAAGKLKRLNPPPDKKAKSKAQSNAAEPAPAPAAALDKAA